MADAACEDEEVEDGMHEGLLVEGVEEGTGNIADALGNNPDDGCCRHAVDEWFEGYQHAEAHADKAERLDAIRGTGF